MNLRGCISCINVNRIESSGGIGEWLEGRIKGVRKGNRKGIQAKRVKSMSDLKDKLET